MSFQRNESYDIAKDLDKSLDKNWKVCKKGNFWEIVYQNITLAILKDGRVFAAEHLFSFTRPWPRRDGRELKFIRATSVESIITYLWMILDRLDEYPL